MCELRGRLQCDSCVVFVGPLQGRRGEIWHWWAIICYHPGKPEQRTPSQRFVCVCETDIMMSPSVMIWTKLRLKLVCIYRVYTQLFYSPTRLPCWFVAVIRLNLLVFQCLMLTWSWLDMRWRRLSRGKHLETWKPFFLQLVCKLDESSHVLPQSSFIQHFLFCFYVKWSVPGVFQATLQKPCTMPWR